MLICHKVCILKHYLLEVKMKYFSILIIAILMCNLSLAARFESISRSKTESKTFRSWKNEIRDLREQIRLELEKIEIYNSYYQMTAGVYKIYRSRGQSEYKMVRHFAHFFGGYISSSEMLEVKRLRNISTHDITYAILPDEYVGTISEPLASTARMTSKWMIESIENKKNLAVYSYGVSGRAYGDFEHGGLIIINRRTNELMEIGNGWSD